MKHYIWNFEYMIYCILNYESVREYSTIKEMVFYRARSEMMIEVLFAESEAGSMKVAKIQLCLEKQMAPLLSGLLGKRNLQNGNTPDG